MTTPMDLKDGNTEYPDFPVKFRIMGYDCEDVNYENNPNGNPLHSMTLWSEYSLRTMQWSKGEKTYALTEDTHFHKEYELELIVTSDGNIPKSTATGYSTIYINFFLVDKNLTGYNRIWGSYTGEYSIHFNEATNKWEVRRNSTGEVLFTTKSNTAEPFDNRYISNDTIDISNEEELLWEKKDDNFIIVNAFKDYFTYDGSKYMADNSITNNEEIPPNTYYEINSDLNGARAIIGCYRKDFAGYNKNRHGNSEYKNSQVQQYLNSDDEASMEGIPSWYKEKQTLWTSVNSDYNTWPGLLKLFKDPKFKEHIATTRHLCERNFCCSGGGYDILYEKVSLPNITHVDVNSSGKGNTYIENKYHHDYNGNFEVMTNRRKLFDYIYQCFLKDSSSSYINSIRRRPYFKDTNTFHNVWLRSPNCWTAYYQLYIGSSGGIGNWILNGARNALGVAPMLTII